MRLDLTALLLVLGLGLMLLSSFYTGLPLVRHTGLQLRQRLFPPVLFEPPVAVCAYDAREHIVCQFDSLRAVVIVEPHQARFNHPGELRSRSDATARRRRGRSCSGSPTPAW